MKKQKIAGEATTLIERTVPSSLRLVLHPSGMKETWNMQLGLVVESPTESPGCCQ